MRVPRFHVPSLDGPAEAVVDLPADAAHHAIHVLRLRVDAPVRLFDGQGNEIEARVESLGRRHARVRLGQRVAPCAESALHIVLAAAPLRGDLFDLVIQKATELGVSAIWPVASARTEAGGQALLSGTRLERWRKVAVSAAAQCGRAIVPRVDPAASLRAVLDRPFEGLRLLLDESSPSEDALPLLPQAPAAVQLLVGPAGGWTPDEVQLLSEGRGSFRVSLGPRTLRAETAALAAVVAVQVAWGDLQLTARASG